jgi:DNA ligase-associated metallophosphoesterase
VTERLVETGPGRFAHATGALWLPDCRTVLIADAHLGYAWAQRRRGQMAPPVDGGLMNRLQSVLEDLHPETAVFLGDLVHAARPCEEERAIILSVLERLRTRVRLVLVPGNHDRGFVRDFPSADIQVEDCWTCPGMLACHGDKPVEITSRTHVIAGHLHPAYLLRDRAGAYRKAPAFVVTKRATILPAFSPLAGGVPVNGGAPAELFAWIGRSKPAIVLATGTRAVRWPPKRTRFTGTSP